MFLNHHYIKFSLSLKVQVYASIAINRCLRATLNETELINCKKTNIKNCNQIHAVLTIKVSRVRQNFQSILGHPVDNV